ncbi:MAG: HTH domain-containing protein [Ignavibacteriota bacterium]|nr:HTH domain-containing protein [Ignavibacteriota bacterium]MCZ2267636.1 putative DNA binding domain-containing protein [Ignavibacteriales bacterium]QKJ99041.1 MAG: HTH domain-containing protein [Ignavibacteriota bacterium]HOJ06987.1 putative DNA binding domain-containing protein [Ignavibacteriaceae bacterium]
MSIELVKSLLKKRERIRIEFKRAQNYIPENLFETVCAFLNREGGSILLGVDNEGNVAGVDSSSVSQMKADISSLSNNSTKLNPTFLLFPSEVEIKGRKIIHIQVPASSQVHKCNGVIFDRSSDGDFRVTNPEGIAEIYNRKRSHFTEGKIYPHLQPGDFKEGLLAKVRYLIKDNKPNHPWLGLSDDEFFRTSGLLRRDYQTGEEGFTLAAVLLLGKDEVIKDVLPHFKIDALVKIKDLDRYDDRLIIESNLIEAYNQLMDFAAKHLPDKFYLEGDTRISLRERIFREVIANLIVHREYTNAHSASFIIYKDRVEILNANNPNGSGPISISNFIPFPKNPIISKFFVQIGRVDELGSGIINVHKYLEFYSPGSKAQFIEDYLFKTLIPISLIKDRKIPEPHDINELINDLVNDLVSDLVKQRLVREIKLLESDKYNLKKLSVELKVSEATVKRDMKFLKEKELIEFEGSPKKGYYKLTKKILDKVKYKAE